MMKVATSCCPAEDPACRVGWGGRALGARPSREADRHVRWGGIIGRRRQTINPSYCCRPSYQRWAYSVFALRAIIFVGLLLVALGWDWKSDRSLMGVGRKGGEGGSSTSSTSSVKYNFVLVGIPLLEHIIPLRALAGELASRGHRVTMALPEGWDDLISGMDGGKKGGGASSSGVIMYMAAGPAVPPLQYSNGTSSSMARGYSRPRRMGGWASKADLLTFMQWCMRLEASMYPSLRQSLQSHAPDFVIVDRYAFAGIDACHDLGLPYAVNNPTLLLDIDEPPAYVAPPYSGLVLGAEGTVWQRCLHFIYRTALRFTLLQAFQDMNTFRSSVGLRPIRGRRDLYGGRLVLTNTIFGIEAPRPLRPLYRMVGPLLMDGGRGGGGEAPPTKLQAIKRGGAQVASWLESISSKAGGPSSEESVLLVYLSDEKAMSETEARAFLQSLSETRRPTIWLLPSYLTDLATPSVGGGKGASSSSALPASLLLLSSSSWSLSLLLALLRHPRISTIITSCGLSIVQEGLLHGKNLLCLPVSLDQREVASRLKTLGLAETCAMESLSRRHKGAQGAASCISVALRAFQGRGNATTAWQVWAQELLRRSSGGPSRAADLVLHILEVGSYGLIPRADYGMPWYHYMQVEVLLVYTFLLFALFTLRMGWTLLLRLCSSRRAATKPVSLAATRNVLAMADMGGPGMLGTCCGKVAAGQQAHHLNHDSHIDPTTAAAAAPPTDSAASPSSASADACEGAAAAGMGVVGDKPGEER